MKQAHLGLHRGQVGLVIPRLDVQDDHRLRELGFFCAAPLGLLDDLLLGLGGGELLGRHLAEEVELVVVVVRVGVGACGGSGLGSGGSSGGGGGSSPSGGGSSSGDRDALARAGEGSAEKGFNVREPAGGGGIGLGVRGRGEGGEDGEVVAGGLVAVKGG